MKRIVRLVFEDELQWAKTLTAFDKAGCRHPGGGINEEVAARVVSEWAERSLNGDRPREEVKP